MSSTPQTLKRLGVATVGALTLLSTPYVGGAVAFAAAPGAAPIPTDVTITSQVSGNSSPRNDGTDTTVKVSANVAYSPAVAPASNAAAPGSVRFTYRPSGGTTDVLIAVDNTAPYSVQWNPPAGGGTGYTLNAEALDSAGNPYPVAARSTDLTTSVIDASSVHITSPAEGGTVGYFDGAGKNTIVVAGTRSADLPAIDLYTQFRDNVTGTLTPTTVDLAAAPNGTVGSGVPAAGASQAWSTTASVPGPVPANADVVITAVAANEGTSDEVTQAKLQKQVLTSVTVAPPSANKPAGSTQVYDVTALDQNGKGVAGLLVTAASSNVAVATIDSPQTTGVTGVARFTATSSATAPGTTTLTFQTAQDGVGYDAAKDFTRTATLTTYTSKATTATLTAVPAKALYAGQSEYTAGSFPKVNLCVVDQNGQGTPAGTGGTPIVTVTRTDSTTVAGTTPTAAPVGATPQSGTNCYTVNYPAKTGTYGTDVIKAYFDNDGTPGYQANSTDVAAAPLTLKYADLSITGLNTQAQKGTATTVSFKVLGADGSPFANRKITLSTPTDATTGFTATQPSGTTAPTATTPNDVIATTDANGIARATVNSKPKTPADPADVNVVVTASDDVPTSKAPDQVPTNVTPGTATVQFRDKSIALGGMSFYRNVCPISPSVNNTDCDTRPGDAQPVRVELRDTDGKSLVNTAVTLTLDHGFFTPDCVNESTDEPYTKCTFDPARADGAKVGNLKSLGTTKGFTSNDQGYFDATIAIGRDAGFDDDGRVVAQVTGIANGGTFTTKDADGIPFTTNGYKPINGGTVSLVPVPSTSTLSGNKQARPVDTNQEAPLTPVRFAVHVTDQFGNLVRLSNSDVQLSVTGGGLINGDTSSSAQGSYTGDETAYSLTSATTSTTGQLNTVKATWDAPVTLFKATTTPVGTTPVSTTWTTVAGTPVTKTASFSVNMYAIDLANLKPVFASKPGNSVPVNTAVTTSATVNDQYGNAVQELCVRFLRSGPGSQSGEAGANDPFFNQCSLKTNAAGKAGYSYSSTSPGTATVTVIVSDTSGNELSRGVQKVTFTTGTTANKPSFSLGTHVISAGQTDRLVVRGTPGQTVQVLAYSLPSTTYKVVRTGTLNSAGTAVFYVAPGTNSRIYVRSAAGQAASQHITVKSALTLAASAKGRVGTFTGKVFPAVVGRTVTIYYVKGGKAVAAGSAKVAKGGTYTFSRTFAAPGQKISFFAQSAADSLNASGRSLTRQITFGR